MSANLNTTKANILKDDNEKLKKWALEASAAEGKILYTSEMIRRLISEHITKSGDSYPTGEIGEEP